MTTLFVIEHALADLFDARLELLDQAAFADDQIQEKQAALDAIDQAISEYVTAEVRKVDNIARFLLEMKARILARELEIDRLERLNADDEETEKRVKEICLMCLNEDKLKRYEGKIGTLRRQANGGVGGIDVRQPELVPEGLKRYVVTMKGDLYHWIRSVITEFEKEHAIHPLAHAVMDGAKAEPDLTAIGEVLRKGVPCPECSAPKEADDTGYFCGLCGGDGTILGSVPGCVLKPRSEHLRVS